MRVKNISKKVIGNQNFRLLPGETMEVSGAECWVVNNLEGKRLEKVAETAVSESQAASEEEAEAAAEKSAAETEAEKPAAKAGKKTVGK